MPLHEWETFYVIIGSSAAALTGLQFVVIALTSERQVGGEEAVATFGTPTIVHFCAVLTAAAIVSIPHQSATSLSLCISIGGFAGAAYSIITAIRARRQKAYKPVLEDWLWHVWFPLCAYVAATIAGVAARAHAAAALYVIGAVVLVLLFVGIHNAWDSAVYISTGRHDGE